MDGLKIYWRGIMARKVFFSFHYENDINRSMVVCNSWVTQGKEAAGFIDKAEFEKIERQGERSVCSWIDKQLEGTSVTVVLIGEETLNRPFVHYEIRKSLQRKNALIGVHINGIEDMRTSMTSAKGNVHTVIRITLMVHRCILTLYVIEYMIM